MSESNTLEEGRLAGSPIRAGARRALVKSFGCQMNVYDSQRMADLAAREGYGEATRAEDADLIVLNTCHIRERASEKIFSELGKLRELKEERLRAGLKTSIVVAGCVAQAEGAEILRRQPAVDVVVGPQSYHRLPELLREAEVRPGVIDTDFPVEDKFHASAGEHGGGGRKARRRRLRDGPGGLRQVLLLLRRALHARRRSLAARGRDP